LLVLAFRTDVAIRMRLTIAIDARIEKAVTIVIRTAVARRWFNSCNRQEPAVISRGT